MAASRGQLDAVLQHLGKYLAKETPSPYHQCCTQSRTNHSRQGILNTFGVFQTYYESGELFSTSSSNISWIGSIQALMVLLVGAVVGPVYDNGYFRYLLVFGSFFIVFGFMMLSLCNEFWQCLLAQGFCVGIGGGALFVPAVAIMPTYFTSKLGLALGLAASGSSMGGIIYPIMFYRLLDEVAQISLVPAGGRAGVRGVIRGPRDAQPGGHPANGQW